MDETPFFPLCPAADIANGGRRIFEVQGCSVLLLRIANQFHAIRNRCTHLDFPLETGRLVGFSIFCRKHGAEFDLRTGKALGGPAVKRLETYVTRVVDGIVEAAVPTPNPNGWPE